MHYYTSIPAHNSNILHVKRYTYCPQRTAHLLVVCPAVAGTAYHCLPRHDNPAPYTSSVYPVWALCHPYRGQVLAPVQCTTHPLVVVKTMVWRSGRDSILTSTVSFGTLSLVTERRLSKHLLATGADENAYSSEPVAYVKDFR
jgi:hypothetical protein